MIRTYFIALIGALVTNPAFADCPAKSPSIKGRVTFSDGDQRVSDAWLEKTLVGRRVRFDEGTEHYEVDGSYSYKVGSQKWDATSYKFYSNGLRCIGYPSPRYDMYVVNDGKLVLINGDGKRFVGKVLK